MAKNPEESAQNGVSPWAINRWALDRWTSALAIRGIRAYQLVLSPLMGSHCRFHPSCSQYALEAYQRFGVVKGSWLSLKRLAKCHPWHPGGADPLPEKPTQRPAG